jgi:hypothetical protein
MKRILTTVSAMLISSAAAADEYLYLYVSAKDADGSSVRHRLECTDDECKAELAGEARTLELSDAQRGELIGALQAETRHFVLGDGVAGDDDLVKLKMKYETRRQRLAIERRIPADNPDAVTPQMRAVLKTYLNLDLARFVPAEPEAGAEPGSGSALKEQGKP